MHNVLIGAQILISVVVIVSILMQPSKMDGLTNMITGTGDTFYSKNKSRTRETILARITAVAALAFAGVTVALALVK
ncbi:MAG: preprotein translocase subunit SecG [Bacillota bacterium]|nr:preprotein translocase subunit SecG [Bacillota bacterium]